MTVYSVSDSPKKIASAHEQRWSSTRRQIFNKKNVCVWILIALLPFLMLRLVFFYASPFLFLSPPESDAELRTELEFPTPEVSRSGPKQTTETPTDSSSAPTASSSLSGNLAPKGSEESKTSIGTKPPTEDSTVDPEAVNPVHVSPETPRLNEEESFPLEEQSEEDENLGSPEDNDEKEADKWQAPPPTDEIVEDKHGIEQVTSSNETETALAPAAPKKCDLYDGDWVHDPEGPLYTNESCFYIQGHQNCMKNGRPDSAYLYWKWKPRHCDLPRFDAKSFLEMFWGKSIGFVGDSLSRNQMQSLLCMLSQVEIPDLIYQNDDDKNVRWLFKTHQVTLGTVWSPYLLKETAVDLKGIGEGQSKVFTDILDEEWTFVMNDFDVMVLSIGQWYFKSSVYIENDEVIGCHYCPELNLTEIGFFQAYRKAVRCVLDKVVKDYKGLAIMSTFALDHFENGSWSEGGSCTREQPFTTEQKAFDGMNYDMHQIVIEEYESTLRRRKRNSKKLHLEVLDVTLLSLLRGDGHPGPYRVYHPFEGKPPGTHIQNDCLHWCLPGPVDTWNQFLVEMVSSQLKK